MHTPDSSIRLPHPAIRTLGPGYQSPPNSPGWVYFHRGHAWYTPYWDEVPEDQQLMMEATRVCCPAVAESGPQEIHKAAQVAPISAWFSCLLPNGGNALDGHNHGPVAP